MQVDCAIGAGADFVIFLATSCTRGQGRIQQLAEYGSNIYDRFVRIGESDPDQESRDLACYSIPSLDDTCVFSQDNIKSIKDYQSRFFDLDLAIYENQCIIESSLHALVHYGLPFVFDQGGFENPVFGNIKPKNYFAAFNQHRSQINQWTLCSTLPKSPQPHLHIVDPAVHKNIAEYFYQTIVDTLPNY
jgi:hypothetical protein